MLEKEWNNYDCFVIQAPTAFGKSALAKTILNSQKSVSYITPTNQLVKQFLDEFPDTPTLSRLDAYHCEEWQRPCSITRAKKKSFCSTRRGDCGNCPASTDLSRAKYRTGPGVYNYHIYMAHKLYRDVLVVDEAHNLIPHIRGRMALHLWQHDYRYPSNAFSNQQLLEWFLAQPERIRKHKKMRLLQAALQSPRPEYVVSRTRRDFNGKGTVRGVSEERDCIELLPVDISRAPAFFWPSTVKKVILLSATINHRDVAALGIRGRICYIQCESPIPSEHRPIIIDPVVSVNRGNMEEAAELLATRIQQIEQQHMGEKGVIHATYQMSKLLQKYLIGPQYVFHDRLNKQSQYSKFLRGEEGTVLIASGMYEGIDLPHDLGRWQVISKIPWPSLGNPAIRYQADRDPEWYIWECLRTVIQACGRISRAEDDYGITYCLDSSFDKLFTEGQHLMPQWYQSALHNVSDWKPTILP